MTIEDSAGRAIGVGDLIRFRGKEYTIKGFELGKGTHGCAQILLEGDVFPEVLVAIGFGNVLNAHVLKWIMKIV